MNVTLSVDDEVFQKARQRAEAIGSSVDQLILEYLEEFVSRRHSSSDAE
jgi:predicted HicB family RNase H-like nuclease